MVGTFCGLSSNGVAKSAEHGLVLGKGFKVAAAPPPPNDVQSNPRLRSTVAMEYFTGSVRPR